MDLTDKNFEDVFSRNLIVGLSSFMYDVIQIKQTVKGETTMKKVPFFYSESGNEQLLTDYFLNTDKYCNVLSPKIEGNLVTIPSGRFSIGGVAITTDDLGSGYVRANYDEKVIGEMVDEMRSISARTNFIPLKYDIEMKVKCGSDIERLKVFDAVIKKLYKVKKFTIKYEGFRKLPCLISFPESMNMAKNFIFQYPTDDKRPLLIFNVEVLSYLPVIDETTKRNNEERIDELRDNTTAQGS